MNEQRRQAAIEAGARALDPQAWQDNLWAPFVDKQRQMQERARQKAAVVIDAALPHLALGYIRLEPGAHAVVTTTGGEVRLPIPGTYALVPAEDDE